MWLFCGFRLRLRFTPEGLEGERDVTDSETPSESISHQTDHEATHRPNTCALKLPRTPFLDRVTNGAADNPQIEKAWLRDYFRTADRTGIWAIRRAVRPNRH